MVLTCFVISIYPDFNRRYRALFNRECNPRILECSRTEAQVMIMWTRTAKSTKCNPWSPNHFVPCYDATMGSFSGNLPSLSSHFTQPPTKPKQIYTPPPDRKGLSKMSLATKHQSSINLAPKHFYSSPACMQLKTPQ